MSDTTHPVAESDVLLEALNVSKSFPGVRALGDVRITVRRGRLNALLGENGAGKSTLMNILSGVFPPDSGTLRLNGRVISFRSPHEAQQAGISTIYQELNLVPHLSVAENVFLGREPLNRLGLIDFRKMHAQAQSLLAKLGLDVDPRVRVSKLRVGAQQVVEIAKAISFDAQVIIMDEPTSALSQQEVESLFGIIRQLKEQGVGIIYITHKLDELPHIADDVTIFRDGQFVAERPYKETSSDEIVRLMVGREIGNLNRTPPDSAAEILRVRGLSLAHPDRADDWVVRDVSFYVHRGEILGLFGVMGAGRTELLQTIFGVYPKSSSGEVSISGSPIEIRSPADAIRAGIALAPEDRKAEGLVLTMNVAENISLPCLERATQCGVLRLSDERKLAADFVDRLHIKTPSLRHRVRNLSGGNQQKVVISKWLAMEPKVLLLDEPTRGIDLNAKREMHTLIDELTHAGLGIVLASSELPEILALADRILVLADGRISAEFARDEATEENLLRAALPKGTAREAVPA
jgi:ABC-type sugar transport system ATPase subunit